MIQGLELVNDFSTLTSHLQSIDESFAKLAQQFENHKNQNQNQNQNQNRNQNQNVVPSPSSEDLELIYPNLHGNTPRAPISSTSYQEELRPTSHVGDTQGNERYFGSTSGLSQFEASRQQLNCLLEENEQKTSTSDDVFDIGALIARNPTLKANLKTQYENFPFSHNCEPTPMNGEVNNVDTDPLTAPTVVACPPMVFLNASLDCFLEEINSIDPIFNGDKLRESIDLHYSLPEDERNESRSLCFNNIIILATTAQLRNAGRSAAINGMEKELLKSFLSNTTRAFRNLDAFCSPSILNVQALTTLTFVAREHCSQSVADALCHRVCNVVRTMGLQQSYVLDDTVLGPGSEREAIYWTLYIMDKHRTFMTGHPCSLYLFDSDLNLLNTNHSSPSDLWKLKLAQIHLMAIWEEIYISLYSQRAMRLRSLQTQDKMTGSLFGLLRNWTSHYRGVLGQSPATDPSPASYLQIELKYSFHIAQVLILRHSSTPADVQLCIDNARAAVMVILGLSRTAFTIGSMSLLARLFRNYPVVAFLKLYNASFGVSIPQLASSLQLLLKCSRVLASVKETYQSPTAYYNRLYLGLIWYTDNLTLILNAAEPKESSHAASGSVASAFSSDTFFSHHRLPSEFPKKSSIQDENSGSNEVEFPTSNLGSMWETRCDFGTLSFEGTLGTKFSMKNANTFPFLSSASTDSMTSLGDDMDGMQMQGSLSLEQYLPTSIDFMPNDSSFDGLSAFDFPVQLGNEYGDLEMPNGGLDIF